MIERQCWIKKGRQVSGWTDWIISAWPVRAVLFLPEARTIHPLVPLPNNLSTYYIFNIPSTYTTTEITGEQVNGIEARFVGKIQENGNVVKIERILSFSVHKDFVRKCLAMNCNVSNTQTHKYQYTPTTFKTCSRQTSSYCAMIWLIIKKECASSVICVTSPKHVPCSIMCFLFSFFSLKQ